MFSTIKSTLKGIGDKFSDSASKFGEKIAAIDPNDIVDPGHRFGPLWEHNENVENCRECGVKFQHLIKRKHHCRSCAGVFCDTCCPTVVDDGEEKRMCLGCIRGETPNEKIKDLMRSQLELESGPSNDTLLDKVLDKTASKVSETLKLPKSPTGHNFTSNAIQLTRGTAFPDDGKTAEKPLPPSGYFEFYNKTNDICCIKVLRFGSNLKFEVPRPSYVAIPPKNYVHGTFNAEEYGIDIFLLYDNIFPVIPGQTIIYDTKAPRMTKDKISGCAKVEEFNKISVFTINAKGKNVILKYKGGGIILARKGDSIGRVGLLAKLQGHRYSTNKLDYSTNVEGLSLDFSYST